MGGDGPGKPKRAVAPVTACEREPTEAEAAAIATARAYQAARPERTRVGLKIEGQTAHLSQPHADLAGWGDQMRETFGSRSDHFANQAFQDLLNAIGGGVRHATEQEANAFLALMGGIAPRDELEAALGVQMAAAHAASLDFLQRARANSGKHVEAAAAYAGMAVKLQRTMVALAETLAKLRNGGRQRIEVVYVNGPAVFGDNAQTLVAGGTLRGIGENVGQPHAPPAIAGVAAALGLPMRGQDPEGDALPGAGDPWKEAVQDARGPLAGGADREGERPLHVREVDTRVSGGEAADAGDSQGNPST